MTDIMKNERKTYCAPEMELITVCGEFCFAQSKEIKANGNDIYDVMENEYGMF